MHKITVFNYIDLAIDEITPKMCQKLIEKGYAKKHRVAFAIPGHESVGIITSAFTKNELEHIIRKAKSDLIKTKCWECGKEIEVKTFAKRSYCSECVSEYKQQYEKELEQYLRYKAKFMLNRSMRILENQKCVININDYKEVYEVLKESIEKDYQKFDSAHEMVATMELIRNEIHVKTHPLIANHKPDFMLKDLKIILEIDGYMHKTSLEKDFQFDIDMRKELGSEWEIVRIPTEYIEENITKLIEAIIKLKEYKHKTRKENGGVLPKWFSARDKKAWNKLGM